MRNEMLLRGVGAVTGDRWFFVASSSTIAGLLWSETMLSVLWLWVGREG